MSWHHLAACAACSNSCVAHYTVRTPHLVSSQPSLVFLARALRAQQPDIHSKQTDEEGARALLVSVNKAVALLWTVKQLYAHALQAYAQAVV